MVTGLPGESQDQPLILSLRVLLGKMINFSELCFFFFFPPENLQRSYPEINE